MKLTRRVQQITPSATLAISAKAKSMKAGGEDVIVLSAGEPDFDTPADIKASAIQSLQNGFTKYTPATGVLALREAISKKLEHENNLHYPPDQIIVSCGAKHALYNVCQVLLEPGDEAIISAPYWLSYPQMVILAGAKPVVIPTRAEDGFKLCPVEFEKAVTKKTKLWILNSPSNPTGSVYTKEELTVLAEICRKKSIVIVSDEIYEKFIFDGLMHYSIGAMCAGIQEMTVTVNGASKAYAMTGWRIGYAACPLPIAKAVASLQSHSTSNPTSFAQMGFLGALTKGSEKVTSEMHDIFEYRRNLMAGLLSKIPQFSFFTPQGAFYIFCDISKTKLSSLDFAMRLLEEAKVAVVPGKPFGDDHAVRVSFAASEEKIREGVRRIGNWLKKL